MTRYPHTTPWKPAIGFAAFASVATLAVAVILPAVACGPCVDHPFLATRDARAGQVSVRIERVDMPVAQSAAVAAPLAGRG